MKEWGVKFDLPEHLAEKAASFPESSYGACASPKLRSTFEINKMQKRLCIMLHVACGSRNEPGRGFQ